MASHSSFTVQSDASRVESQSDQSEEEVLDRPILNLHFETNRLATFADWSHDEVRPADLAKAGFYYTNSEDRVKCAFCHGMLKNWEQGDDPLAEHRLHFPDCAFVKGNQTINVRIEEGIAPANAADLGIVTGRPRHPEFATLTSRLESFSSWPPHRRQQPDQLANAGFYFAGFGDNVKCFFCDGGLRNWEPTDNPWEEHAKWFPRCTYVKQCKGQAFIDSVRLPQSTSQITSTHIGVSRTAENTQATGGVHSIAAREITARLDTPTVQAILHMGYPRDKVKKAIRRRLETTGDDFSNAQSLVEAILNLEEDDRQIGGASVNPPLPDLHTGMTPIGPTKIKTVSKDADSLLAENQLLKDERMCKICMDQESNIVFLPCGHMICCVSCAVAIRHCPMCRTLIRGSVRTYMS